MAYVQPNGIIQLFQGINLDNRYLHTIYFANETLQDTWFTSKVFKTYQNQSYTRYTRNQIKIKEPTTNLFGCTYMRFQNARTSGQTTIDKWFYAFINSIEYVNENTTLITYEIDVMQTWFIQVGSLQPCMVIREHVTNDEFGKNLEAEPIGSDVYDNDEIYYFGKDGESNPFEDYSVVMQTTGDAGVNNRMIQGLYSGCNYVAEPANNVGDGDHIYSVGVGMMGSWSLQQQQEQIIDLYTVPSFCAEKNSSTGRYDVIGHLSTGQKIQIPSQYDNYTPKNNKLFMYPFSYLLLTTHTGDVSIYRWEYFEGTTGADCEFDVDGTMLGGGEIRCYPKSYNGQLLNIDAGVVMSNFPKNTANYDAYQAWLAGGGSTRLENDRQIAAVKGTGAVINTIGGILGSMITPESSTFKDYTSAEAGAFMGYPYANQASAQTVTTHSRGLNAGGTTASVGGALNTAGSLMEAKNNIQYTFNDASYAPNIVIGKPTSSLPVAQRNANFYFFHCHVRDDEVKRIDDFFSCYGYSINRVKIPNLTGRTYWNFVQTQGAVIKGNMPASSKEAIGRIFDSGITFWHNGDQIGNYRQSVTYETINNPIVSST